MTSCSEMRRLPLHAIAHGRAGDKGNVSNVSLVAYRPEAYNFLATNVTADKVHKLYAHLGASGVTRYDLPSSLHLILLLTMFWMAGSMHRGQLTGMAKR